MTSIGFYILESNATSATEHLACRLAEKAYNNKLSLYIYTESRQQSEQLDAMLWSFRQGSFIPHALEEAHDELVPIRIGHRTPSGDADMLINMTDEVPKFFSRFQKMAEIVPGSRKPQGRRRYTYYNERGYKLVTHKI